MTHSEEYLGDYRFSWYNDDFLNLMAKRWSLQNRSVLVDVGCGLCHWSMLLLPFLKSPSKVIGVDFEKKWIEDLEKVKPFFQKKKSILELMHCSAEKIDLPDNYCDVVTCQTLLIHVTNKENVVKEFYRILKSGGILICAEPNNLVNPLLFDNVSKNEDFETTLEKVKFELLYAKGKSDLGLGESSAVETIPNLLKKVGLKEIKVFLSDKVELENQDKMTSFPETFEGMKKAEHEKSLNYYVSAGGKKEDFEKYWEIMAKYYSEKENEVKRTEYLSCTGRLMYLISGVKN